MAFEEACFRHDSHFIDYVAFLGHLIKTRAVVKLLIKKGTIATENLLGHEETLADLSNSFGKELVSDNQHRFLRSLAASESLL